jgi:hypothetical protein
MMEGVFFLFFFFCGLENLLTKPIFVKVDSRLWAPGGKASKRTLATYPSHPLVRQ